MLGLQWQSGKDCVSRGKAYDVVQSKQVSDCKETVLGAMQWNLWTNWAQSHPAPSELVEPMTVGGSTEWSPNTYRP